MKIIRVDKDNKVTIMGKELKALLETLDRMDKTIEKYQGKKENE